MWEKTKLIITSEKSIHHCLLGSFDNIYWLSINDFQKSNEISLNNSSFGWISTLGYYRHLYSLRWTNELSCISICWRGLIMMQFIGLIWNLLLFLFEWKCGAQNNNKIYIVELLKFFSSKSFMFDAVRL